MRDSWGLCGGGGGDVRVVAVGAAVGSGRVADTAHASGAADTARGSGAAGIEARGSGAAGIEARGSGAAKGSAAVKDSGLGGGAGADTTGIGIAGSHAVPIPCGADETSWGYVAVVRAGELAAARRALGPALMTQVRDAAIGQYLDLIKLAIGTASFARYFTVWRPAYPQAKGAAAAVLQLPAGRPAGRPAADERGDRRDARHTEGRTHEPRPVRHK
jgi:hypothetical protein